MTEDFKITGNFDILKSPGCSFLRFCADSQIRVEITLEAFNESQRLINEERKRLTEKREIGN